MDFELTEEQKMLQKMAKDMSEKHFKEKAFTWDKRDEYPWENAKILAKNNMLVSGSLRRMAEVVRASWMLSRDGADHHGLPQYCRRL